MHQKKTTVGMKLKNKGKETKQEDGKEEVKEEIKEETKEEEVHVCQECEENNATKYCKDCELKQCDDCVTHIHKLKKKEKIMF